MSILSISTSPRGTVACEAGPDHRSCSAPASKEYCESGPAPASTKMFTTPGSLRRTATARGVPPLNSLLLHLKGPMAALGLAFKCSRPLTLSSDKRFSNRVVRSNPFKLSGSLSIPHASSSVKIRGLMLSILHTSRVDASDSLMYGVLSSSFSRDERFSLEGKAALCGAAYRRKDARATSRWCSVTNSSTSRAAWSKCARRLANTLSKHGHGSDLG
mmetsp:Transcript_17691/g.41531  ORF Transcript_17691/g.41531 Transcript_17691/m.41531 type:complete len:216 (-) Transcript_17691:118-765(-)